MSSSIPPELSLVVPVFNEAPNIDRMAARLVQAGEDSGLTFEVLFSDDGSSDGTDAQLDAWAKRDPRVRAVHLSRNFGHMAALTAGLENALGTDAIVCLDGDGQHPPELIPDMVRVWKTGIDVVQMVRAESAGSSWAKRTTSSAFYGVLNRLSGIELVDGAADFRLMDRQVVDAINSLPERERFLRGIVFWVGYRRAYLPFAAPERMGGTTKYNFRKMFAFAVSGVTSFSNRPLRIAMLLSGIFTLLAFLYAVFIVWSYLRGAPLAFGWASGIMVSLILGSMQLLCIGILSEYVARLYTETKQRPTYLLRKSKPGDNHE